VINALQDKEAFLKCEEDLEKARSSQQTCEQELHQAKEACKIPTDFWYFKQFISQLLNHMGSPVS
jgi:hypothetical protein